MRQPTSVLAFTMVVAIAHGLRAQATWTVTNPNGVDAAIAAAAPGDLILLPNTGGFPDYTPFAVTKGVTIRGNGCRVGQPLGASTPYVLTIQVPPGQRAHLDGLNLTWAQHASGDIGMQIVHNSGVATVQRCLVRSSVREATLVLGGAIVFQSCSLQSTRLAGSTVPFAMPGLLVQGGVATVRDCNLQGANAGVIFSPHPSSLPAGPGALVEGGLLHAERSTFQGGSGFASSVYYAGACGLSVNLSGSAWIAEGALIGGGTGWFQLPGHAVCNTTANEVQLANVTLTPGNPSMPASSGSVNTAAPLCRLAVEPVFQRGVTSTLAITGQPSDVFALFLALDLAPTAHPLLVEPAWIVANIPIMFGLLNATGTGALAVNVPTTPALQHQVVWTQAVSGNLLPLHASTLAGGLIL